jgi:hypothetical protein
VAPRVGLLLEDPRSPATREPGNPGDEEDGGTGPGREKALAELLGFRGHSGGRAQATEGDTVQQVRLISGTYE